MIQVTYTKARRWFWIVMSSIIFIGLIYIKNHRATDMALLVILLGAYALGGLLACYLLYIIFRWAVRDILDIHPVKNERSGHDFWFWWSCLFMLILGLITYLVATHGRCCRAPRLVRTISRRKSFCSWAAGAPQLIQHAQIVHCNILGCIALIVVPQLSLSSGRGLRGRKRRLSKLCTN
jgi:hypothetical protein